MLGIHFTASPWAFSSSLSTLSLQSHCISLSCSSYNLLFFLTHPLCFSWASLELLFDLPETCSLLTLHFLFITFLPISIPSPTSLDPFPWAFYIPCPYFTGPPPSLYFHVISHLYVHSTEIFSISTLRLLSPAKENHIAIRGVSLHVLVLSISCNLLSVLNCTT